MTDNTNEIATTDHQPPRVRQCVFVLSLSAFFSLLLLYFFNVCANVSPHVAFREEEVLSNFSFSLFPVQMAPSIWTSKVFRNLAKTNERTVLRAEVTPGFRQARDIRHRG